MAVARVRVIVNPIAGVRHHLDVPALLKQHLDPARLRAEVVYSQYAGHAPHLARAAVADGCDAVVAVGGDGTINEVATQLVGTPTALGIVPLGSGNGLARHLRLPLAPAAAVRALNAFRRTRIDSGEINGRPFFCTAGVGFDAHVGALFANHPTRGFQGYVRTTLRAYFQYQPGHYQLETPALQRAGTAFTVTFANAGQYGNNAWIAPRADLRDGLLDVCWVRPFSPLLLPLLGTMLFSRTLHHAPGVDITQTDVARLYFEGTVPAHVDGEPVCLQGPLEVCVRPQALLVMA